MRSFCANCGAPIEEGAAFCGSCGAPVQNAVEPMQPAVPVEPPVAPVESQPAAPAESAAPAQAPVYPVYQQPVYAQPVSPLKGSNGVGVTSFVMSMVSLVATIAVIAIIASIMDSVSSFYFSFSELQTLCTSGIVLAILALLVSIVGLILGIVGVARRNVKKGMALTGLIINGVELLVDFVVIGMMMPIFLEGAAGAGAPAAIAAPFLVALGFDPVTAVAIALLGDATPASWGGAGLTTINGGAALVDAGLATVAQNAAMVGRFHMFGVLIIPFIMTFMAFGKKGFKGAVPYLTFAGVSTCLVMFALSNFVGAEVTSMGTGLISMLLSVAYVRVVGIKTPEEYRNRSESTTRRYSSFRAMSPYIYMLVLLPVIRYGFPAVVENGFAVMCTFGYIVWVDVVILLCGVLGAVTLKVKSRTYFDVCRRTVSNVAPVMITMGSLLIVAYIMQSSNTGMMNLLATDIARVVGRFYPAAAVLIGSSGAFITGTGLGSNIMFAQMHIDAAASLGMNPITIFAGQNAGASLGNLICPNNTVAACATVDEVGNEGAVMKKTLKAFAIILVLYMVLAMLYTCVLFPHFGA